MDLSNLQEKSDARGALHIGEVGKQIPFDIRRFFIISRVPPGSVRGEHAHKCTEQAAFCLQGSFSITADDGKNVATRRLAAAEGAILHRRTWHTLGDFSADCIVLVVASEPYDESDYIRNYDEFRAHLAA